MMNPSREYSARDPAGQYMNGNTRTAAPAPGLRRMDHHQHQPQHHHQPQQHQWTNNAYGNEADEDVLSSSAPAAPEASSAIHSLSMRSNGTTTSAGMQGRSMSAAFAMEEQKQQLFGICECVQSSVRALLDRIGRIAMAMDGETNSNSGKPLQLLLEEYELGAWPLLVDVDLQVKLLASTVRQTIDACNINEPRLSWLLAVNKFQVEMEKMVGTLIRQISVDLERVLRLRVRCNIHGLELKKDTMETLKEMQREIRSK